MKKQTNKKQTISFNPFLGAEIVSVIPITQPQSEIWISCLFGEDANRAYNESISLVLNGNLNKVALKNAVSKIVKRHEALRSTFSPDGRFMIIYKELPVEFYLQDISELNITEKTNAIEEYLSEEANYVFDLTKGPLLKIGLLKLSEQEHQLVLTAHHIICDGWSLGIMLEELGSFYSTQIEEGIPDIPKPETFLSYAEDEERFIGSAEYKKTEEYWLKQYEFSVPTITLPTDFPRPKIRTYKSNRLDFGVDNELVSDLKKVGIKSGASFVVTLLAAFEVFLFRQTGQYDLVLGLPAAGQSQSGKTQLIGHCVSLLPLRSKLAANIPFNTYLKNRKNAIFDAYDHQQFSFGQLLQKLNIPRDFSRVPLVPITFNIDMGMANTVAFNGLSYKLKSNPRSFEAFEISLNATGTEDELILEWSYNTSLFKTKTIEQMMATFKEILHSIVENPSNEIGSIIKVDSSASLKLNDTSASSSNVVFEEINYLKVEDFTNYFEGKSIIDLFLSQVKNTPNNIAVVFEDKKLTYIELDNLSNQFSNYIINSHNIKVNDLVSVMLKRSEWIIVCAIGILKSGAAYVPIEPDYPEKRKNYIIDDSQCKITVDNSFLTKFINELDKLSPKLNDAIKILPDSLCYIIYTSGTTGNPKGVMIEHRNVVSLLYHGKHLFNFNKNDVWTMFHSFCFDFSVWEMYGALLFGGKLIMVPEMIAKDPFEFISMIEKEGVTVLNQTPSAFINLMESANQLELSLNLRYIIFGGEALFPKHLEKWYIQYPDIKFINMYGITETTVHVTFKEIKKVDIENNQSNIGTCISTLSAFILDEFKNPQPEGVVGELYIAGKGVARGYLNRPELTKERFLPNIFNKDERMYRSGDLAKWLPNREIEFVGRIDDQVKIRGYRIEIKEVEAALNALPNIKHSVVITSNHLAGELSLVAYLQPFTTKGDSNTVRSQLEQILPDFQIPSTFMWVEKFPLSTNGKIDKKNLPSPEYIRPNSFNTLKTPQTDLEKIIAKIWGELLQIPVIDIEDDFFEMGGHSLVAVKVMARLEKETGNRLPLSALFEYSSIAKLAKFMDKDDQSSNWNSLVPIKPNGNKTPLYIVHGGKFNVLNFHGIAKNLDDNQPVYGLQAKGLNGIDEPHASVQEMVDCYVSEIISKQPEGPYALAGYSFGGIIAFEMARELKAQGKKVTSLVLFDTYASLDFYYTNPIKKTLIMTFYWSTHPFYVMFLMFNIAKYFIGKINIELIKAKILNTYLNNKKGKEKQHQTLNNLPSKPETNKSPSKIESNKWPKLRKMHRTAIRRYNITPLDIEIDLFKAAINDVFFAHDKKHLGWKKIALKGVRSHITPGNHNNMLNPPNDKKLAEDLQHILDINESNL